MRNSKFSREDSKKRRYTVNWVDQSDGETRVDDRFWMLWTCLPTFVHTAISNGEFYKRRSCGSEQRGTVTLRTESGSRTRDDEQRQTNFDPDHI